MSTIKKISCFLCFIFVASIVGICNVKAATLTVSKQNVKPGETFVLYIKDTNEGSIYSLNYDSSLIEKRKYSDNCSNVSSISGNGEITFYAKTEGTVNFSFKDKNELDSTEPLKVTISSPAQTTTQLTTTPSTTTQASKSNNANLKTLEITGSDDSEVVLSPSFSSNVYEYSATVAGEVKTVTINATMEDSKANMVVSNNATEELVAGENNKIVITVTAEDGTKKAYTINIKREALTADATLKSLTIKECSDFELKENKFSYSVKIKDSVKKLTLDYVTSDENAEVSISGNENLKNGSKVKILVTAQDGTKKEYVLNIVKDTETTKKSSVDVEAEKNPLIIMALSMVAFGLIGGIIYVIKK